MSARPLQPLEREQLDLFHSRPGALAPRDAQDLMAFPFFSLAKSIRLKPIDFKAGSVSIRVEAVPEHGMATIWDADVLRWRQHPTRSSPSSDAEQVCGGLPASEGGARPAAIHNGCHLHTAARRAAHAPLLLESMNGRSALLSTGASKDWIHAMSGNLSPLEHFAFDLRDTVRRQALAGYRLVIERRALGTERLAFTPVPANSLQSPVRRRSGKPRPVDNPVEKL